LQELRKKLSDIAEMITSEKSFCKIIIFIMLALPIAELFDERHYQTFNSQPTLVEIAGLTAFFCIVVHFLKHKNIKYYASDLIYLLLIVFMSLSAAFTLDKEATFLGFYYDEWMTDFVGYFSLMMAGTMITDKKLKKEIIRAFFIVIFLQTFVAFLQTFGLNIDQCFFDTEDIRYRKMCYGLLQHSNWYGGLSVLMFACSAGVFLFVENKLARNSSLVLSLVCFYTLLCTEARLALVGVFAFFFFLAVSIAVMKLKGYNKEKMNSIIKRACILVASSAAVAAFTIFVLGRLKWKFEKTATEVQEFKNGNIGALGTDRATIWKAGLKTVPGHWLFGIGLDNYRHAFYMDPDFKKGMLTQGKAHNEYIHYLVTQGALQLINYLSLLVLAAVTAVRTVIHTDDDDERFINWILLGMFFGYAAQAFFNSSVVNVAPYFWITIGLCLSKANQRPFGYRKALKKASAEKK